jgi:membrane protease subunit HflK
MEKLMAWNEPGKNGDDNDPGGGGGRGKNDGPPDIDEVLKNLTKKFNSMLGGSSKRGGGSGSSC